MYLLFAVNFLARQVVCGMDLGTWGEGWLILLPLGKLLQEGCLVTIHICRARGSL